MSFFLYNPTQLRITFRLYPREPNPEQTAWRQKAHHRAAIRHVVIEPKTRVDMEEKYGLTDDKDQPDILAFRKSHSLFRLDELGQAIPLGSLYPSRSLLPPPLPAPAPVAIERKSSPELAFEPAPETEPEPPSVPVPPGPVTPRGEQEVPESEEPAPPFAPLSDPPPSDPLLRCSICKEFTSATPFGLGVHERACRKRRAAQEG